MYGINFLKYYNWPHSSLWLRVNGATALQHNRNILSVTSNTCSFTESWALKIMCEPSCTQSQRQVKSITYNFILSLYKLFRLVICCQHDGTHHLHNSASTLQPKRFSSVLQVSMKAQKRFIKLVHSPLKTTQISGKGKGGGVCSLDKTPRRPKQRDNDTGEKR